MSSTAFKVSEIFEETPDIKRFTLTAQTGQVAQWQAGAHVRVGLGAGGDRAYSLLDLPDLAPDQIALGVLREPQGTGGSLFMHALKLGDLVDVCAPVNHFALDDHAGTSLLIAGGIGITPILSMSVALQRAGRAYSVHYAGRRHSSLAFVTQMQLICGDALTLHYDDQKNALNIAEVLGTAPKDAHIYVCGPAGMIEAVKAEALSQGRDPAHFHAELFTADASSGDDTAFDVEISSTGQIVHVAADQTIIEALEGAGLDPLYDCQRGDCGICQCDVISGVPDHRDVILTEAEKAAGEVMQICVSRSKSPKLVLDI